MSCIRYLIAICVLCSQAFLNSGYVEYEFGWGTGRQLRPLSSVVYRIISKRRYILAAQLLLRDHQVPREVALAAISLACLLVQCYSIGRS